MRLFASDTPQQARKRLWLYVVFICLFLDLGGALGIRVLALTVISVSLFLHPSALVSVFRSPLIIAIFLIWPMIAAIIGFVSGADIALVIQNIVALMSFPFLVAFFSTFKLQDSLWAVESSALTVSMVAVFFWFAISMNDPLALATAEKLSVMEVGYFGLRELGGMTFSVVYFKATLFYVFVGVLLIARKRYLALSLVLLALMAAMSKTGVVVIVTILIIRAVVGRPILIFTLAAAGLMVVLTSVDYSSISSVFSALSEDTNTVTVRLEHWESIGSIFKENPLSFVFGQGAGTMFYSIAAGEYVNNIELDHLNSIRKFGIVWFSSLSLFVGYVIYALFKGNEKWLSLTLFVTFLICGTNPVLLTLLFMSILAVCYVAVSQSNYLELSTVSNC